MSKKFEKNRYLSLDGNPMEHGFIRRTLAPKGLAVSFLVAAGFTINPKQLNDFGDLIPAIVITAFGVIHRRCFHLLTNFGVWQLDFRNYVIDTRPSLKIAHNPPLLYDFRAISAALATSTVALVELSGAIKSDISFEKMKEVSQLDIPFLFPTFHLAAQQAYAYNNVRLGKWKIVKTNDMQLELDIQPTPVIPVLTPSGV